MIGAVGRVGRLGLFGGAIRRVVRSADFTLSNASVATIWGTVEVGNLVPSDAPAGAYFVIVGEPAGLAVVNG
ncbi:hypothetical protein [Sandarakinorhabdus sp.]|uniref:hypothetical protein n=1 Tax=Sandarakinorhabdus sp. TaxID=1916663 RepID=UPI003F6F1960